MSLRLNRDFKNAHDSVQELPSVVATDVATSVASQSLSTAQTVGCGNPTMACASSRPALTSFEPKRPAAATNEETKR